MISLDLASIDWEKSQHLVPAIVQSIVDKTVLMHAYMNKEALQKTLETGKATFFSRTRSALWTKGETSGNFLLVKEIHLDCDQDTLLLLVDPTGPCCHTHSLSCFEAGISWLTRLEEIIDSRFGKEGSYVAQLLQGGPYAIARKIGEEAVELALASTQSDKQAVAEESADLLFHLMVNLCQQNIALSEVVQILKKRNKCTYSPPPPFPG